MRVLKKQNKADNMVVCVPSGNFGNICAGIFAHEMGLPIKRFIAANNANDIFYKYLQSGKYEPKPSKQTLANAMDVGDPSNFARIYDLFGGCHEKITSLISGATYTDDMIKDTMQTCHKETGYVLDPHGACGYRALKEGLKNGETGVFLETAHPIKFLDIVEPTLKIKLPIPQQIESVLDKEKVSTKIKTYQDLKDFLQKTK